MNASARFFDTVSRLSTQKGRTVIASMVYDSSIGTLRIDVASQWGDTYYGSDDTTFVKAANLIESDYNLKPQTKEAGQ